MQNLKNESPVSAGQIVKTLSKHATDFKAKCTQMTLLDCVLFTAWTTLALSILAMLKGGLQ